MSITIPKRKLAEAFRPIAKVVPTKATLPCLQHVRFRAHAGADHAVLQAQDLDQYLLYCVQLAEPVVGTDIDFAIECSELRSLVKGGGKLSFTVKGDTVAVEDNGGPCIELPIYSTAEIPDTPEIPKNVAYVPLPTNFASFLADASRCASSDPTRALLGGVNLSDMGITATSGTELYHVALPLTMLAKDIVINYSPALASLKQRLHSITTWSEKDSRQFFAIRGENFTYVAKTIGGSYPNWQQVIPEESSFDLTATWTGTEASVLERFLRSVDKRPSAYVELEVAQDKVTVCDASGRSVSFAASTRGSNVPCRTSVKTEFLAKLLALGHSTLRINSREDGPMKAEGAPGFYLFMPARREANQQRVAASQAADSPKTEASRTDKRPESSPGIEAAKERDKPKSSPDAEARNEPENTPAQQEKTARERPESTPRGGLPSAEQTKQRPVAEKENTSMKTNTSVTKFIPPPGEAANENDNEDGILSIEEASQCIEQLRSRFKELDRQLLQANRKLKEALLAHRRKKRQYSSAVKKLERIRQASGF